MRPFSCTKGASMLAILLRPRRVTGLSLSLYFIGIILTSVSISFFPPVSASAAAAKENRTFTEVTAGTDTGFFAVTVAGGILVYVTDSLEIRNNPDFGDTPVSIRRLKFVVDPGRITHVVENGVSRLINPGEKFGLDETVPFAATPEWNTAAPQPVGAADLGDGRTRVIIPYVMFEGGCAFFNEFGGPQCQTPPGGTLNLNADSDPFDRLLAFAEIIIDLATKTIQSIQRVITTAEHANGFFDVATNSVRGQGFSL